MINNKNVTLSLVLKRLIRPLARLMMAQGMTYRDFADIGKTAFLEEAQSLLSKQDSKQTISHISLISGLHRKEVSQFVGENPEKPLSRIVADKNSGSSYAGVIAEWISNPVFAGNDGKPASLPYSASEELPNFSMLVEKISKDVRPNVFLSEMQRLGLVETGGDKNETITLKMDAFVPKDNFEEKLNLFEHNVGDHLKAAVSNMGNDAPPFFERSAFHDRLSPQDVEFLRQIINKDGMDFLKTVYKNAKDLSEKSGAAGQLKSESEQRITCGLYFYAEPNTSSKDKI